MHNNVYASRNIDTVFCNCFRFKPFNSDCPSNISFLLPTPPCCLAKGLTRFIQRSVEWRVTSAEWTPSRACATTVSVSVVATSRVALPLPMSSETDLLDTEVAGVKLPSGFEVGFTYDVIVQVSRAADFLGLFSRHVHKYRSLHSVHAPLSSESIFRCCFRNSELF